MSDLRNPELHKTWPTRPPLSKRALRLRWAGGIALLVGTVTANWYHTASAEDAARRYDFLAATEPQRLGVANFCSALVTRQAGGSVLIELTTGINARQIARLQLNYDTDLTDRHVLANGAIPQQVDFGDGTSVEIPTSLPLKPLTTTMNGQKVTVLETRFTTDGPPPDKIDVVTDPIVTFPDGRDGARRSVNPVVSCPIIQ